METDKFFAYSWSVDSSDANSTTIRIYGLNEKNETVCVSVPDFTPYIYIELPIEEDWGTVKDPNISKAQLLVTKLNSLVGNRKPKCFQLMFKKKLYGANLIVKKVPGKKPVLTKKLFPFLFCSFYNPEDIEFLTRKIRSRPITVPGIGTFMLKAHENNASPILQLTAQRKLPSAGWIKFKGKRRLDPDENGANTSNEKLTQCDHEYEVKWKMLSPLNTCKSVVRPLILSFDLEVYSSVTNTFPDANRPDDKIFQCSCVLARQGTKSDQWKRILLSLGKVDRKKLVKGTEVREFECESDLILGFTALVKEKNPSWITGHNILGFDLPYLIERAKLLCIMYDFDKMGMHKYNHGKELTISWSSAAFKNQNFTYLSLEGRDFIDVLPLVKRDYKLSSYTLKAIALYFFKDIEKDPLDVKGIFRCYEIGMKGTKAGQSALGIVGKYCVLDSEIALRVLEVMRAWIGMCEMSRENKVQIFTLVSQGQQIRTFSSIYTKCTHENTVVQRDGYVSKDTDAYIGASVQVPEPKVYNTVVPLDFQSLYPSIIIANNLCMSTMVEGDIPEEFCQETRWHDHLGCEHDPNIIELNRLTAKINELDLELKAMRKERDKKENRDRKEEIKIDIANFILRMKPLRQERVRIKKSKPKRIICGERHFRWIKSDVYKGVLPEILQDLLDSRAATKAEMKEIKKQLEGMKDGPEKEELETYLSVLDVRQNAKKLCANSGYGALSVRKGYLPCLPVGMTTTWFGRTYIAKAIKSVTTDHGGVLVYGDSVTGDTPILVKYPNESINVCTIDTLADGGSLLTPTWHDYDQFKSEDKQNRTDKEYSAVSAQVWTHKGWSQINRVIRHKTHKKMYRILTHTGCVDVTEDHSLLRSNMKLLKPSDADIGDSLLHSFPDTFEEFDTDIVERYEGHDTSYRVTEFDAFYWGTIIGNMDVSKVGSDNKLHHLFYSKGRLSIPYPILNTSEENTLTFLCAVFANNSSFSCESKLVISGIYLLFRKLGMNPIIDIIENKYVISNNTGMTDTCIKKIIQLEDSEDYVYDLETVEGVFQAGIGSLIVKNTDSAYVSFPHIDNIKECWDYATKVSQDISTLFPKGVRILFEEKIYAIFLILTKKRYMSLTCDSTGKVSDKISKKGVLLTRRDNCDAIRKIYSDIVMMAFYKENPVKILDHLLEELNKLCSGFYPFKDFAITKAVGDIGDLEPRQAKDEKTGKDCWKVGDYKVKLLPDDPVKRRKEMDRKEASTEKEYYLQSMPAQVQLAEAMKRRGTLVAAGSRLEYVITTMGGPKAKQCDKITDLEYFSRHSRSLKIDYMYYLKLLCAPIDQVLAAVFGKTHPDSNFVTGQYKLRLKRQKVITELNMLFKPQIVLKSAKK